MKNVFQKRPGRGRLSRHKNTSSKDLRNADSCKVLYYAHVRSLLEYCCQVWNPEKITHLGELEIINR
jgi:hypothetical protein